MPGTLRYLPHFTCSLLSLLKKATGESQCTTFREGSLRPLNIIPKVLNEDAAYYEGGDGGGGRCFVGAGKDGEQATRKWEPTNDPDRL